MSLQIQIDDQATTALRNLLLQVSGRRGHAILGQAVRVLVRDHLRQKESQPNKQGWPKTHFYSRARERTTFEATEDSATVTIALEGFRQRYHGGRIAPVNRRALTIPAAPEAYGKVAGEFGGSLEFRPLFRGQLVGLLVGAAGSALDGKVLYRLVKSVNQAADPSVLPTNAEMLAAAQRALEKAVANS